MLFMPVIFIYAYMLILSLPQQNVFAVFRPIKICYNILSLRRIYSFTRNTRDFSRGICAQDSQASLEYICYFSIKQHTSCVCRSEFFLAFFVKKVPKRRI